jgi:hypothetical protein
MLSLKKKIIFINIKKSHKKILKLSFYYYFIKKSNLSILLYLTTCTLQKNSIISKRLKYFYTLKWNCATLFILNSKLNFLIEFFYNIKNLNLIQKLNHLPNHKYFLSVIRSPFVYKKSMEQFYCENYKVNYQTNILAYNFFFHNYQYVHLKNFLHKKKFLKLFCKLTFTY